jgi:hypothetical protein
VDTIAAHLDPNGDSDGDGIINRDDPQQFKADSPPQNNGDDSNENCQSGDVNLDPLIEVDAGGGDDCLRDISLREYSTVFDEAYCNAIYYWHSACLAWATGLPHWDDPYGAFNYPNWSFADLCIEVMEESGNYGLCSIPQGQYCAAVPAADRCQ